jgi:histidine ammonia-lyase
MNLVILDGENLTLQEIIEVARYKFKIQISDSAKERIIKSRKIVEEYVAKDKVAYGITTGFGKFSDVAISQEDSKKLQRKLIISHACGTGEKFSTEVVRAIMLLRINALSKGFSGISLETLNTLVELVNREVHPLIPKKGSLGASGDLAPLAHMVLPMLGEGEAEFKGEVMAGVEAMKKAGIPIIELTEKEGLALINGTQVMTAAGAINLYDSLQLLQISDVAAALTAEALRGIKDAYDERIHIIRPHQGQINTARNMLNLTKGSSFMTKQGELRVQDAYSLRCVPQIHGASKDAINYVREKVEIEINSVTDNPIITEEGEIISGGNFHGQPMALSFDFLAIAVAELANVSERRLERLINYQLNDLPPFLAKHGGLNSGFMITQYAAASLVSENKILCHPACVDSIPSSANQEDHVSMGTIAAVKCKEVVNNTRRVLATEMLAACQAIDFRDGLELGVGTKAAYEVIRKKADFLTEDVIMYKEIDKTEELINNGEILKAVNSKVKLF